MELTMNKQRARQLYELADRLSKLDINTLSEEQRQQRNSMIAKLQEEVQGMSRAAKGYEKYGKEGMQALAKAGREGKDLDKIRDKYNKYDDGVTEEFNGEYDDESGMAKSNLRTMARAVNGLLDTIEDNDNLPEWAQEKIAKAEMMTTSVWDYLLSQKEQGMDPKVTEASQRVDSLVTDALKIMRGSDYQVDAVKAIKTVLGDREYNSRRGHYNFYVRQLMDMYGQEGVAEGSLKEFAPGSGGGESGRWYTDDQITDIVGDGWYNDLDVSGDIPKQQMIQQAQAWLDDQGYSVQVLNCKVNDDDMEWYIEGSFQNSRFAKKSVAETKKPSPKLTAVNIKKTDPVSEEINTEAYERLQKVFAFKNYES